MDGFYGGPVCVAASTLRLLLLHECRRPIIKWKTISCMSALQAIACRCLNVTSLELSYRIIHLRLHNGEDHLKTCKKAITPHTMSEQRAASILHLQLKLYNWIKYQS